MIDHPVVRIGLLMRRLKSVDTRKKFQKIVHILQVMGAPFPESFDFHHYGPFSSELARELEAFKAEQLLTEEEVRGNFVSFRIHGSEKLETLLCQAPDLVEEPWLDWAESLNTQSAQTLEGVSTLLYFHQRLWPKDAWFGKFKALKPHLMGQYPAFESEALALLKIAGKSAA